MAQDTPFYSPENRIRFADYLYCSGDFFRAGLEYNEVYLNNNDSIAYLKFIIAQWRSDNIEDIISSISAFPQGKMRNKAAAFVYALAVTRFDFKLLQPKSMVQIEKLTNGITSNSLSAISQSENYIYGLQQDPPIEASDEVINELGILRDKFASLPLKIPVLAGIFSAIIPGSGKIYTGEIGDGITAFTLTALFAYLAYSNFEHDHTTRAWIFTAVGSGFYLGNIYGSVVSAKLRNEKTLYNMKSEISSFIIKHNWFLDFKLEMPCTL